MNKDFHYYGTFVAARLAGYSHEEAQTIAHAAQYVDESAPDKLSVGGLGFKPVPTIQTTKQILDVVFQQKLNWAFRKQSMRVWPAFHFLPGNYELESKRSFDFDKLNGLSYGNGKVNLKVKKFTAEQKEQFKLVCLPNSPLVEAMIKNTIEHHCDKDYTLHLIGLRMHVLADTWAHMYYAGIPAQFINDARNVYNYITSDDKEEIDWKKILGLYWGKEEYTPNIFVSDNSLAYLGHGRMGHLPDYPYMRYKYTPQWSSNRITKNNPACFLKAFIQMVYTMSCIKENKEFSLKEYKALNEDKLKELNLNEANLIELKRVLSAVKNDQCETWKRQMGNFKTESGSISLPEEHNENKWLKEAIIAEDKRNTDYFKFNFSASEHLKFVIAELEKANISIGATTKRNIYAVTLKSEPELFISEMGRYGEISPTAYNPKMSTQGIEISIIKPSAEPLKYGDIVEIKTTESSVGKSCYLGSEEDKLHSHCRFMIQPLYNIQKWKIEYPDGNDYKVEIKMPAQMRLKSCNSTEEQYLACENKDRNSINKGYSYLITSTEKNNKTIWIMDKFEIKKNSVPILSTDSITLQADNGDYIARRYPKQRGNYELRLDTEHTPFKWDLSDQNGDRELKDKDKIYIKIPDSGSGDESAYLDMTGSDISSTCTRKEGITSTTWQIQKVDGSAGDEIRSGDRVRILNKAEENKKHPFLTWTTPYISGCCLLTPSNQNLDNSIWVIRKAE